jgi:hypothetical protein
MLRYIIGLYESVAVIEIQESLSRNWEAKLPFPSTSLGDLAAFYERLWQQRS